MMREPHSEYKQGMGMQHSEHKLGMPQSHRAASPASLVGRHDAGSGGGHVTGGGQPGGHGGGYAGGYAGYGGVGENTGGSGGHGGYSEDGGRSGYQGGHWHHGGGPGHQHGQPGQHGQHGQRSLLQKPQGSALSQLQGRVRRLQGGEKSLKFIVNILLITQLILL